TRPRAWSVRGALRISRARLTVAQGPQKRGPVADGAVRICEVQQARDRRRNERARDRFARRGEGRPAGHTGTRGMNRIAARAFKVGIALSTAVGLTALAVSGARSILLDVYFLGMGGILLLALVRTTREGGSIGISDFDRALEEMGRRPSDSGE